MSFNDKLKNISWIIFNIEAHIEASKLYLLISVLIFLYDQNGPIPLIFEGLSELNNSSEFYIKSYFQSSSSK